MLAIFIFTFVFVAVEAFRGAFSAHTIGHVPNFLKHRLHIRQAKKAQSAGGGGFGSKPTKAVSPPGAIPAIPREVFTISNYDLPKGEGISTLFMGAFIIEDSSVCDDLTSLFEANKDKAKPGQIGRDGRCDMIEHSLRVLYH